MATKPWRRYTSSLLMRERNMLTRFSSWKRNEEIRAFSSPFAPRILPLGLSSQSKSTQITSSSKSLLRNGPAESENADPTTHLRMVRTARRQTATAAIHQRCQEVPTFLEFCVTIQTATPSARLATSRRRTASGASPTTSTRQARIRLLEAFGIRS